MRREKKIYKEKVKELTRKREENGIEKWNVCRKHKEERDGEKERKIKWEKKERKKKERKKGEKNK